MDLVVYQLLSLALCKAPNRVGVLHFLLKTKTDPVFETLYSLDLRILDDGSSPDIQ
jgi:hypothetical protein